jgi:hypothetical protein
LLRGNVEPMNFDDVNEDDEEDDDDDELFVTFLRNDLEINCCFGGDETEDDEDDVVVVTRPILRSFDF